MVTTDATPLTLLAHERNTIVKWTRHTIHESDVKNKLAWLINKDAM